MTIPRIIEMQIAAHSRIDQIISRFDALNDNIRLLRNQLGIPLPPEEPQESVEICEPQESVEICGFPQTS